MTRTCAHYDVHGQPILDSAICADCEGDAGRRMMSWKRAKAHVCTCDHGAGHTCYEGGPREDAPGLRCVFCRCLDRRKPVAMEAQVDAGRS